MTQKFNKSEKSLLICDMLDHIVVLFSDTFLIAYLLQISIENISIISIYNIIVFLVLGLFGFLIGNYMKKSIKNKINVFRSGIILKSLFVLLVAILKNDIVNYYVLLAGIYGIALSLFWSPYDVMITECIKNEIKHDWLSYKRILCKFVNIIIPIILGASIDIMSFSNMAIYIFIITIIEVLLSFNIKYNSTESKRTSYKVIDFIKTLKEKKYNKLLKLNISAFFYGIVMDTIRVSVVIITIMTFKTSFSLGILSTIFSICSMIILFLYNKYNKQNNMKRTLIICSIISVLGIVGLLFNISKETLIIYNFTYSISICILEILYKYLEHDYPEKYNLSNVLEEYHTTSHMCMQLGRIFGFSLLLFAGLNNILIFKVVLLFLTLCIPIYAYTLFICYRKD